MPQYRENPNGVLIAPGDYVNTGELLDIPPKDLQLAVRGQVITVAAEAPEQGAYVGD